MGVRKIELQKGARIERMEEERELIKILGTVQNKTNHSTILYEETLNFYGLWETSLLFFDLKNGEIILPEEMSGNVPEILKEYNNETSYKMYNLISYNFLDFSPLFLFFYFDGLSKKYINTFVYDNNNPKLTPKIIKENFQHLVLDEIDPERIVEKIFHLYTFKSKPFLFIQK